MENKKLPSLLRGRDIIKRYIAELPHAPGVYRMIDDTGKVLYIGKAKSLKNRVTSYTQLPALNQRMQRVVGQTATMEFVITRSEAEALLLEANLVKKLAPRYNILLRDDKSFPYIFICEEHPYPRIAKHRGPKTRKGRYIGPFVSAGAVNETLTYLQRMFLLRPCSDNVFKNRTRPCLQYQIKRCSAPCVGKISVEDYGQLINQAEQFLSGKSREIQDALIADMQRLSLAMRYEEATNIRDRIKVFAQIQVQKNLTQQSIKDADVIAVSKQGRDCCVQLFAMRGGFNYGSKTWFFNSVADQSEGEILGAFIPQLYATQIAPASILVSHALLDGDLIEQALKLNSQYHIEILQPLRGEKLKLIEQAQQNAREALIRHLAMHAGTQELMRGVKELFGLDEDPKRIEVYDNSHIMGAHAVGAMIVAGPDGFNKNEYRKFNIKSAPTPGDDYAMMREVLMRRFLRLQDAGPEDMQKKPDLVLIDGGAGQLSSACQIFEELGVRDVALVAISKGPDRNAGREEFHMPNRESFQLEHNSPVLHYLQRLRDEAHRFAIGTHRNKRSKAQFTSPLDEIDSIGPTRKKALLHHFGSAKAVSAASLQDIEAVPGISKQIARVVYGHFHDSMES